MIYPNQQNYFMRQISIISLVVMSSVLSGCAQTSTNTHLETLPSTINTTALVSPTVQINTATTQTPVATPISTTLPTTTKHTTALAPRISPQTITSSGSTLSQQPVTPTPQPPSAETTSWKVYQNEQYQYSISYPPTDFVKDFSEQNSSNILSWVEIGNPDTHGTSVTITVWPYDSLSKSNREIDKSSPSIKRLVNGNKLTIIDGIDPSILDANGHHVGAPFVHVYLSKHGHLYSLEMFGTIDSPNVSAFIDSFNVK